MYILMTKEEKSESCSEVNIFRTIVDLFTAGSETTATSLLWGFLYLTKYPKIQHQCREEIQKLTGFSRMVTMADKNELPFVNATILEVQRIGAVAAVGGPHVAEEDITLGGFDLPKGTTVQFMIGAVQNDPRYWDNPEKFLPERWLTKDNKIIKKDAFLPFSWGPRSCLGEPLARMEMFLFFTNLLQRFEFTDAPNEPVSVSAKMNGITYQPIKSLICAKPL
ncbi:Cytochrome P450 2J1,Cytochrome P450 2J2,Cytochrome P450 2D17,Cytochrome P450 2D10,Cytochrome P450 2C54,Vitamin D 25-hydroxylase,Cytochrome P450 2K1,Cytochrome P450 2D1,Cytochrome P450 2B11,Cytochrome P450 2K4,Cytochrome P450 2A12,Cytochrome P450 2J6,Cytochrome P450 2D16,Cytochrome P450 2F2,Cytochrome P450 2D4,Steroid 17-alpha-hydroxylase/17,20 lyase,Cytochrome P450 2A13 [Acanthosepion pharaonis]|uniref:Cytochrome P450 n=1 Tax=Acanthosepion pharaonis TaxID=158019 RepID=A0A812BB72_ACAPH|nr:Cytochrome P450 2J1,Cytochrome P450 2J2,Cytochrome P450 2D17,Cytochrome P450 2D10,Cytochrome P450 2C54,Vitamin D 25-hydroxylase,Cytochrome P450 2K1,Cytochrome P450 2D1,Cytochrome P450 2B11,Cytochrome P450 2K4,Cytochrome P450 2A12,Cytochrome P450 2J6,Cytochrome P450 2D16,Cytochrome P450 2F2,Cytochrome P450 2D4,Steroid 17-alpha-hydroxylase/17,20 lyase,Cytochrome P450 2A13 [Sepia pharaonis]